LSSETWKGGDDDQSATEHAHEITAVEIEQIPSRFGKLVAFWFNSRQIFAAHRRPPAEDVDFIRSAAN